MKYNRLGKSGLQVSELSYGSWVTFGNQLDQAASLNLMKVAVDNGVNFFDNAEAYAAGASESLMGLNLKHFRREDLVISTKIFWGGAGPNQSGLSRKHIIEGTQNSLARLQTDYVDLIFCHRPDPNTPIEETVLAMDYLIRSGMAFYWGTSEWTIGQIEQAFRVAKDLNCIPPTMEQPQYNLLVREKVEVEFARLFEKRKFGTTIWSPLASGVLTGKYKIGIPDGSRLANLEWLKNSLTESGIFTEKTQRMLDKLQRVAKELEMSLAQFSIAWCLKNPNVNTVILGASNEEQLLENLKSAELAERISDEVLKDIDGILSGK